MLGDNKAGELDELGPSHEVVNGGEDDVVGREAGDVAKYNAEDRSGHLLVVSSSLVKVGVGAWRPGSFS